MANGCVHHPLRLNPQRRKWAIAQPPVRVLYPSVRLVRGRQMSPHPPLVNFESMGCVLLHSL
jgi:hypothetical protein